MSRYWIAIASKNHVQSGGNVFQFGFLEIQEKGNNIIFQAIINMEES